MKKLIGLLIALAVVIYIIFSGGPLKKDFTFNGETYRYAKNMYGGEIENHFYTPNGEDFNTTTRFVQILEFDDDIQKNDWTAKLPPLFNRYRLMPFEDNPLDCVGRTQMSGFFYKCYSAPITVDGKEHMAIFISGSKNQHKEDSESDIIDMITAIKNIQFE